MNTEIQSIIHNLENILDGDPWFGRPVYALMREIDPSIASIKPNSQSHSLIELLYHMLTWAEFTLKSVEGGKINDITTYDKLDWREIDPQIHGWEEGLSGYIATHQELIAILGSREDSFLDKKVEFRDYDFRYLLNGLIQHNIYHSGQLAYAKKLLTAA